MRSELAIKKDKVKGLMNKTGWNQKKMAEMTNVPAWKVNQLCKRGLCDEKTLDVIIKSTEKYLRPIPKS